MKIIDTLKAQAGKLKKNIIEQYTILLIVAGVPAIVLIYTDWRAAAASAVFLHIGMGLVALGTKE